MSGTDQTTAWRGVAAERTEDVSASVSALLQARTGRLLRSVLRPHRRAIGWLVVLIVVQNLASLAGPYLVGLGIDRGVPPLLHGRDAGPLVTVVVVLAVAAVVQVVTERAFLVLTARIGQDVVLDLRRRVFDHFQRLSQAFHETYTSGRVISRQTSDVDAISEFLENGVQSVVVAGLSILTIGVTMLLLDVPLALVGLASFVPLLWLTQWFRRESGKAYRASREAVAQVIVQFVETFNGLRAVQAFRREPRNDEIFVGLNERYRVTTKRSFDLIAIYTPGIKLVGNVTVGLVLLYGGHRVLGGHLQVGVLTSFLLYLRRFFDPLQDLSQFFNSFQSATAALEKLSGVLDEPLSVAEAGEPRRLEHARGDLRLRGVEFAYGEQVVLPHLDLHVPAGQTVALVGRTGAGKTTIARLVGRVWDPVRGTVSLDDVDLHDLDDRDLHRAVVTVTQESFLFTGTVADNIAFGRPGATRAEVEEAAREIGAHAFISALPQGYDTPVRKRGGRLSAGQRQLVSFARAFLADPAVLVLDEATSSLDIPSERLVQQALRTILADRTAVIIAHRLSTVEIADRVLVLEAGRVVEDGAPDDLIGSGGRYATLHRQWADSLV
ncbi:ABC transporter ATP-binding protein [Angustibacter peucedani]